MVFSSKWFYILGKHPWSALTRSLSQRMRSYRYSLKRKFVPDDYEEDEDSLRSNADTEKKMALDNCEIKVGATGGIMQSTKEDYEEIKEMARAESGKSTVASKNQIIHCLNQGYLNRLLPFFVFICVSIYYGYMCCFFLLRFACLKVG